LRNKDWRVWAILFIIFLALGAIFVFPSSSPKEEIQARSVEEGVENIEDLSARPVGNWEMQIIDESSGKALEEKIEVNWWIHFFRKAKMAEIQEKETIIEMEPCPIMIVAFSFGWLLVSFFGSFFIAYSLSKRQI